MHRRCLSSGDISGINAIDSADFRKVLKRRIKREKTSSEAFKLVDTWLQRLNSGLLVRDSEPDTECIRDTIAVSEPTTYKMSKSRLPPPAFSRSKRFDIYLREVDAWNAVTKDVDEKGLILGLSLPEDDPQNIREKLWEKIPVEELSGAGGVKKFKEFMSACLGKDDLTMTYESYVEFDRFKRQKNQPIEDFLLEFDQLYSRAHTKGIVLPEVVKAFKLLDCSNADNPLLTLTAVNFENKDTMYTQMKAALRKFQGSQFTATSTSASSEQVIKLEPAFLAEHEEALFSAGYVKRGGYNNRGGGFRGRGGGFRGRGNKSNSPQSAAQGTGADDTKANTGATRKRLNPIGPDGDYLKCVSCLSIRHLLPECPDSWENMGKKTEKAVNNVKVCEVIMFAGASQEDLAAVSSECAYNMKAILDSACTAEVTGEYMLKAFIDTLPPEKKALVKEFPGEKSFRFGDSKIYQSIKEVEIPCRLAGVNTTLRTSVVEGHLPQLLSLSWMKDAGAVIDYPNDKAVIYGKAVDLDITKAGHYAISMTSEKTEECKAVFDECFITLQDADGDPETEKKILKKLHLTYGHRDRDIAQLLKESGAWRDSYTAILADIKDKCETCHRYPKTPPKPVVCLRPASNFNEILTVDLKSWGKVYILYMIDAFTRFTQACVIKNKNPSLVVEQLLKRWISIFGRPGRIWSDIGGEFTDSQMEDMSENLGIEIKTTAAYAPWMNGMNERNHCITDQILEKLLNEQPELPLETALCWAVTAKNSLYMHTGFSSYQLVFGANPNLPNVLTDKPPALEGTTISDSVMAHLQALHSARKGFIEAESSERIRRALRHKIRVVERQYQHGEKVYYKREDSNKWRGPASVIGNEGNTYWLRHGAHAVRAAINRMIPVEAYEAPVEDVKEELSTSAEVASTKKATPITVIGSDESESETEDAVGELEKTGEDNNISEMKEATAVAVESSNETGAVGGAGDNSNQESASNNEIVENTGAGGDEKQDERAITSDASPAEKTSVVRNLKHIPRKNDIIEFRGPQSESWTTATVSSRAGKASGRHRAWINVFDEENREQSLNLDAVEWKYKDLHEVNIIEVDRARQNSSEGFEAKQKELANFTRMGVYNEVPDVNQERISLRWIITEKEVEGVVCLKARLVCRGFEETGFTETDSPTCGKDALRIFASIAVMNGWEPEFTDIQCAFLQGEPLERTVFVEPPVEAKKPGVIWQLNIPVYGLKDGPRRWFLKAEKVLLALGFVQSSSNKAVFFFRQSGNLKGLLALHVDDFIHAGDKCFREETIVKLRSEFEVGKIGKGEFRYTGLNFKTQAEGLEINQHHYVNSINLVKIKDNDKQRAVSQSENTLFRAAVGSVNWASQQTRPDASFEVLELSMRLRDTKVEDVMRVNKCVKKLQYEEVHIFFRKFSSEPMIISWSDAAFANLQDGVSSGCGFVILLADSEGNSCPLAWASNKVKRVVKSTLAAEALPLMKPLDIVSICKLL